MLDFLLGLSLAALVARGWLRGFVREAVDLAGLFIGVFIAFRLSGPFGDAIAERFQVSPEWARIGAGVGLFIIVGLALGVAGHYLTKVMSLPGLNLSNRLLGSGLALAWGLFLVVLFVSVFRALPFPSVVGETIDDSAVISVVAGPEALPQRLFQTVAGDEVLDTLLALRPLIGDQRVVLDGDDRLELDPATEDELDVARDEADEVFMLLNTARTDVGRAPLAWSEGLAAVALGHAREMYLDGYVSHVSPRTGTVGDRVTAAGIRLTIVGENLSLAASPRSVHAGLMASDGHRENILRTRFDRVGVAAVRGPLGLMVVQVFGG